ncbi:MAG: RNA-directed DNA polymerase [Saprospiraceae bacterium]|nr:RNA-directed DNA polymerase [Saprospiraceae bacterium]
MALRHHHQRLQPQEEHVAYFPGDDLFTPLQRRRGLPIGNLTSQFWANAYLNRFDHFVKETLRVPGYIRYVDDFVLFAESKAQLRLWKAERERYLAGLRLLLHPAKTRRHRRFMKGKLRKYLNGEIPPPDRLEAAINAWSVAHSLHEHPRKKWSGRTFARSGATNTAAPDGAGRLFVPTASGTGQPAVHRCRPAFL